MAWRAVVLVVLILGSWSALGARPSFGDYDGTCGGLAPFVSECSSGYTLNWYTWEWGFHYPACALEIPHPKTEPCFVGVLESRLTGPSASESLWCHVLAPPPFDGELEERCYRTGSPAGTYVRHDCYAYAYLPADSGQELVPGAVGPWECVFT